MDSRTMSRRCAACACKRTRSACLCTDITLCISSFSPTYVQLSQARRSCMKASTSECSCPLHTHRDCVRSWPHRPYTEQTDPGLAECTIDAMRRAKILRARQSLRVIELFFYSSGATNKSVMFDDDKKKQPRKCHSHKRWACGWCVGSGVRVMVMAANSRCP